MVNDQDPEGSSAGIEEGEVLTVEQLLYCLLLVSANEAADILAETVSGSREAFVELMNQRRRSWAAPAPTLPTPTACTM